MRSQQSRPTPTLNTLGADQTSMELTDDDEPCLVRPTHFIRVLAVPRVEGTERVGPLELGIVTFLACNGGSATPDQVIDAVWGGKAIERGTFFTRLTKTRNAL